MPSLKNADEQTPQACIEGNQLVTAMRRFFPQWVCYIVGGVDCNTDALWRVTTVVKIVVKWKQ